MSLRKGDHFPFWTKNGAHKNKAFVKVDSGYSVYSECKDKDLFVKDKSGNEFNGWCWPGNSAYADFLNPAAREWFAEQYKFDKYIGKTADYITNNHAIFWSNLV